MVQLYNVEFDVTATIGMKREMRQFLYTVRDEVNFNGGNAIVVEESGWLESYFVFRAEDVDEDLKYYIEQQYQLIVRAAG